MFPTSFVVGAALGAAITYLYKDQPARESFFEKSKQLKDKTIEKMGSLRKKPASDSIEQGQTATASA